MFEVISHRLESNPAVHKEESQLKSSVCVVCVCLCVCHSPGQCGFGLGAVAPSVRKILLMPLLSLSGSFKSVSCPMGYCNWSLLVAGCRFTQTGSYPGWGAWISMVRIKPANGELGSWAP